MRLYLFIQTASLGFFASAAVGSGWIWLISRREFTFLVFSVHCVICALVNACLLGIITATTLGDMNLALSLRSAAGLMLLVTTLLLVKRLTGVQPRWYLNFIFMAVPFLICFNVFVQSLVGPATGIRSIQFPWGEVISAPILPKASLRTLLTFCVVLSVSLFSVFASFRLWLKDRSGGILMGLATLGMLSAHVFGALSDVLRLEVSYLGAAPIVTWVVLIALLLSREYANRGNAVLASEQRFRGIFDQTFQFIGLLTTDGVLMEANRAALDFAGVSEADVVGKPFWETPWWSHSTEMQDRLRNAIQLAAAGQTVRFEATHYRADGLLSVIDFSIKPVRGDYGLVSVLIPEGRDITERLEAERQVRERETFLRLAQDAAGVGSWEWDTSTNVFKWSEGMARIYGIEPSQFDGKLATIIAYCHPDDLERLKETISLTLTGQNLSSFEYRIVRRDGAVRTLWLLGQIDCDIHGSPAKVLGIAIDITESRLAQNENVRLLHHLGERVKELTCLQRTGIILRENSASIADWLRNIVEMLPSGWQYPEDAAAHIALGTLEFSSPEFTRTPWMLQAKFVDAAGNQGLVEVVYLREKPTESEGPFLLEERNLIEAVAEMLRSAIVGRAAVDALVDQQTALRQEKQFIDKLMDSLPAVVYIYDANYRFLKWNQVVTQVTGYSPEEIAGLSPLSFFSAEDTDTVERAIQDVLSQGQNEVECNLQTKDLRSIPYYFKGVRLLTEHGPCVLGIGIDISERRRLEDQFRQSQKMETVGHLAGGIAHDFNNLLTIISGYSELLLEMLSPNDPNRQLITPIQEAGSRAAMLTRQLLAFSRKAVLHPEVFQPNSVVEEVEKMLTRMIGEDILLTTKLAPDIGRIKADRGQLGQVLLNLAVNARDAMPQGGLFTIETYNVTIDEPCRELHSDTKPGAYVVLTASDNGCGMSPEVQSRIFEPFFTTKVVGKGSGLGLSMVYGIVKQSGGHIEVYSEVAKGTTFKLYFPTVNDPATPTTDGAARAAIRRGTETILLVEDQAGVLGLAQLALRNFGYRVVTAVDAADALRLIDQLKEPVDLLITDIVMPGLSGRELAESLLDRFSDLRVLYVSGYTEDVVVKHGLSHADLDFLRKPYSPRSLVAKVQEVLDKGPLPRAKFQVPFANTSRDSQVGQAMPDTVACEVRPGTE